MRNRMQLFKAQVKPAMPLRLATLSAGLLLLVSCASVPQSPTAELQAAELAIKDAERARVSEFASAEMSEARDKLRAANSAVQQEKMVVAKRLAESSGVYG
ncbi:MAG: DUF4398 domain-containing protein [Candidatus Thiodiazotropha sp.]